MKCYICLRITWMFSVCSNIPRSSTLTSRRKKWLMNSNNVRALMSYVMHILKYIMRLTL